MSPPVKTVFVTGANRGIGLEFVKQILEKWQPEHVFATYRSESGAKELIEMSKAHSSLHAIQLDIQNGDDYLRVVKNVEDLVGGCGINVLINNAAVGESGESTLSSLTKSNFWKHLEINTVAPTMLTKALQPLLEKGSASKESCPFGFSKGVVVNITSLLGSMDDNKRGGAIAYRASKAALNSITKTLSIEFVKKGILAVVIHPGWVQTEMGGPGATLTTHDSVAGMIKVMEELKEASNGMFFNYDGRNLPW